MLYHDRCYIYLSLFHYVSIVANECMYGLLRLFTLKLVKKSKQFMDFKFFHWKNAEAMNYTYCYLLQCRTNHWQRENIADTEEQPKQNAITDLSRQTQETVDLVNKKKPQQHLGCDKGNYEHLFWILERFRTLSNIWQRNEYFVEIFDNSYLIMIPFNLK